jgi:hypothetical protein
VPPPGIEVGAIGTRKSYSLSVISHRGLDSAVGVESQGSNPAGGMDVYVVCVVQ